MQRVRRPRALSLAAATLATAASLTGCGDVLGGGADSACAAEEITIEGTDGDDTLRGTEGRDVIDGKDGDDVILGLGGDDLLCGGGGADTVEGGDGDDVVDGGRDLKEVVDTESYEWVGDTLTGGPGDDRLQAGADERDEDEGADRVTFHHASTGVTVDLEKGTATGEGDDELVGYFGILEGSRHDDRLLGSDRADHIDAGPGADHLDGRGGADELLANGRFTGTLELAGEKVPADRGANTLIGGDGDDYLAGEHGADRIDGGAGRDGLHGDLGADELDGGAGDDELWDVLVAPQGGLPQLMDCGAGTDSVDLAVDAPKASRRPGTLDLAAGTLRVVVGEVDLSAPVTGCENAAVPGGWTAYGDDGDNTLLVTEYNTRQPVQLHGRGGDDVLWGERGADLLDGGPGNDVGHVGAGGDELVAIERSEP